MLKWVRLRARACKRLCLHFPLGLFLCMLDTAAGANISSGFYGVVVNGVMQAGFALLVFDAQSRSYMAKQDFLTLGFSKTVPSVMQDGMPLVPLDGHEGMLVTIDNKRQRVSLNVEADWYAPTRLNLNATQPGEALPAAPGALFNYSLQVSGRDHAPVSLSSTQVLSWFSSAGFFQLTTAMKSVDSTQASARDMAEKKFTRLGTVFVRDDPEKLSTLSVGDDVLQASTGVPSVRYGGISWQSNFRLNPSFSTLETPTLFDAARLPSTLEFFLNDRRVGSPITVAPGPFEISGLPTVGVNGMVKVLIRDALNNERVVVVPYLQTPSLYRQGLHGFSYTAAWLRPDLDRYETPFLASSHRWGVTRRVTLDAGAALSTHQSSAGAGATVALFGQAIGNVNLAFSRSPSGTGQKLGASVQWQDSRLSMGASYSHASSAFELLGDVWKARNRPRDDMRFFAARALGSELGSVSISWGRLSAWSGKSRSISSVGWTKSFGGAHVSLSAARSPDGSLLQFMVNIPLDRGVFLSTSVQKHKSGTSARTDFANAAATGNGVAWRVGVEASGVETSPERSRFFAGMDMRSDFGEHGLDLVRTPNGASWRARTAGSLGLLAGHRFYGPPIHGGFALVSTGDAPDIPIYRWNLPVAVSDSQGMALVTTLNPYQKNLLAIKPEEVPLQYRVASNEITAIPRGRGGVLVNFSIVRERPAVLVLASPDGQPLAIGARVHVLSSGETASVGLRGEAYLQNLPAKTEVEVRVKQKKCRVAIDSPLTTDPQPRLGPFVCDLREAP